MSTLNAPPDQINGLTLTLSDTLNVGKGGTVSNVDDGGVINVNGGAANGTNINGGTLNLNDGTISGTTVNVQGNLNLNGGTAIDTNLDIQGTLNVSGGTINGLTFKGSDEVARPLYQLHLKDINSLQGSLGFDGDGGTGYEVQIVFQNDELSSATNTGHSITIHYGKNQSVTYNYTVNDANVSDVNAFGNVLEIQVAELPEAPETALLFSAQSAGTIVYSSEFGSTPSASELTVLSQFAQAQFDYGHMIGVMDPSVYAFEALGVALASSGQHFQNRFGPSNSVYPPSVAGDAQFVMDSYTSVFGRAGTAGQIQQFVGQLKYFETLYTAAGIFGSLSNIDLLARGAIYGQMLGIAHGSNLGGENSPSPVFDLTTGQDSIVLAQSGSIVNGTFGGAGATWTFGDFIASTDTTDETFNIQGIGAAGILNVTSVQGAHVVGVQNVNITAATGQAVQGNFTATGPEAEWLGLTQLTVKSTSGSEGVDNLTVGPDTAVQITDTVTSATNDALTVNGGSTIDIVENRMVQDGEITVNGGGGTTHVSITQTGAGVGNDASVINIVDVNGTSKTDAGTITNVTLDGVFQFNFIIDNALTNLTINNYSADAGVKIEDNLTTPIALPLNLSIGEVGSQGDIAPQLRIVMANDQYSTVHLSLGAENSSLLFEDAGLTTLDTPNHGTGALVASGSNGIFDASRFDDPVQAPVNFDFSGLDGPNNVLITRGGGNYADVYTLGNFGSDNGFFGTNNSGLVQTLYINAFDHGGTINFGSGAYIINDAEHPDTSHNYVETAANGVGLANLNTGAQWAIINQVRGGGNSDTLTFKTDNVQTFVNLGSLDNVPISATSAIAGGIGKALNTSAHTVVEFTFAGNTFIFDHADGSFALTAADAMVELTGIHPITAISATHEIIFA